MHAVGANTAARAATIFALIGVFVGLAYWGLQATGFMGSHERDAIVRAGAPAEASGSQAASGDSVAQPAVALPAELPSLEPAAVPLVPKAPAVAPGHQPSADLRAAAETDSGTSAVSSSDEVGPADVESAGGESKEPPLEPHQPTLGQMYTWEDGDRTLEVWLDPNLVVQSDGDGISREDISASAGDGVVVRGDATESLRAKGDPVFWSSSGELMALPGGAVLVLDASWDVAAVDDFLERNGIDASRLTELDFVANGFFIDTEPGIPSLDLANSLAGQDGVVLASPNWWTEIVTK
ncbi:hypothetical protein [Candidatus Poriferisodalis sp.]|uniref:hypothetical protein n=1 Tax=Candidatus Poriferisodalis sp. TaxID=3101277 RepID=UPI003B525D2E